MFYIIYEMFHYIIKQNKIVFQSKVYRPRNTKITKNMYNQERIGFFSFNLDIILALSDLNLQMTLIF